MRWPRRPGDATGFNPDPTASVSIFIFLLLFLVYDSLISYSSSVSSFSSSSSPTSSNNLYPFPLSHPAWSSLHSLPASSHSSVPSSPHLPSPHLPFFTSSSLFLSSSSPPPFPHLLSLLSSLAFNPDASLTSDLPLWLHHFLLFCILLPTSFCNSSCMLVSPLSNSSSFQSSLVFYDVYCLFSSPFIVSCLSSSFPHCLFSPDFLSLNL